MVRNFLKMPVLLKLCTAASLAVLMWVVVTMFPHTLIHVFGRRITVADWWRMGAGPFMLIVALLMSISAVMLLLRARHARLAYVVAWIALTVAIPFVAGVSGIGVRASESSAISNSLLTLAISLYLYLGKGTREYFRSSTR
jgi:hypothetical protein